MHVARRWLLPILCITMLSMVATFLVLFGCGGGGKKGVVTRLRILDSAGEEVTSLPAETSLFTDIQGLKPRTIYAVRVINAQTGEEVGYVRLPSDSEGTIPETGLAFDLDPGEYIVKVAEVQVTDTGEVEQIILTQNVTVEPEEEEKAISRHRQRRYRRPRVVVCDANGRATSSFEEGESVYVKASRLPPNAKVAFYIVRDRTHWYYGTRLRDRSEGVEIVQANRYGRIPPTRIWTQAQYTPPAGGRRNAANNYDVICDVNRNGLYDRGDGVDDYRLTGFVVQRSVVGQIGDHILAQLACDRWRNYKDVFQVNESVYVWFNPDLRGYWRSIGINVNVTPIRKYVVLHKDQWNTGDPLIDVSELGYTEDRVQSGCTNQNLVRVWPAPLKPGEYDIVIDMNRNGKYDKGIDVLDGVNEDGTTVGFRVPGERAKWVFLIYMNGDNDLEGVAIQELNEMETVGSSSDVKIIVQLDRHASYDTSNGNWTGCRRYLITRDDDTSTINSQLLEDLGEVDMADPNVLRSFIQWAKQRYTSERYMLVLFGHGTGPRMRAHPLSRKRYVMYDESNNSKMDMDQLLTALHGADLDVVAFDMDYMSVMEAAYQLRHVANYMIGTQERMIPGGWPYDTILQAIVAHPTASALAVCQTIVSQYQRANANAGWVSISAIDLSKVADFASKVDELADALVDGNASFCQSVRTARNNTFAFLLPDLRDLYHFAQLAYQNVDDATVKQKAQVIQQLWSSVVVAEAHSQNYSNAHGLSIWLPNSNELAVHLPTYAYNEFASAVSWRDMLRVLWAEPLRIVLTWGSQPSDLDVHLWDPKGRHLTHGMSIPGAKIIGSNDTDGGGPEEIDIDYFGGSPDYPNTSEYYYFAVHANAGTIPSDEDVTVRVYRGGEPTPIRVFTHRFTDPDKRWWHVFRIKTVTQEIETVDQESDAPPRMRSIRLTKRAK